jgi:hypothetical protein
VFLAFCGVVLFVFLAILRYRSSRILTPKSTENGTTPNGV